MAGVTQVCEVMLEHMPFLGEQGSSTEWAMQLRFPAGHIMNADRFTIFIQANFDILTSLKRR